MTSDAWREETRQRAADVWEVQLEMARRKLAEEEADRADLRGQIDRAVDRWHADRATACDEGCLCGARDGLLTAVLAVVQPEIEQARLVAASLLDMQKAENYLAVLERTEQAEAERDQAQELAARLLEQAKEQAERLETIRTIADEARSSARTLNPYDVLAILDQSTEEAP